MRVILIGENGKRIGEVPMQEVEKLATKAGKNLTMVAENVYRIADVGKLKYERNQKQKHQRAQRRAHKIKEIKLGPLTDIHDMEVKAKRIREFLKKGLRTKVTMLFKKRQIAFKDAGLRKMKDFVMPLVEEGLASVDREPKFEGRNLVTLLVPPKV